MFSKGFKHWKKSEDGQSGETSFTLAVRGVGERRGSEGTLVGLGAGLERETPQWRMAESPVDGGVKGMTDRWKTGS